ncbi:MAG: LrgB family protein [Lachnospiraceae bacterium]|nr:LrgB family protein [Lachnospiraceae bacterium]
MEYLESNIFLIALTFVVYWGAKKLQALSGWVVLNPVLITIAVLIAFLKLTGITYETYYSGGRMIEFWLKPAIVALGVPLYSQFKAIRRQLLPIVLSQLAGCLTGIVSVVMIAKGLGASREVIISLAPKSVTTPIAIEIVSKLDGIPSLTAAIVVCVGLIGAVLGLKVLSYGHINSPIAQCISMGTAAHVIGTTRVAEYGDKYGAYATLGLIINGVLTSILTGPILELMGL